MAMSTMKEMLKTYGKKGAKLGLWRVPRERR